MDGTVEKIFIAPAAGATMQAVEEVEALAGSGLRRDRYSQQAGHWDDQCQVTLIEAEDLEAIIRQTKIGVGNGEHRRNLVTRGVRFGNLEGKRFCAGAALLEFEGPRPPCSYLQTVTEKGMTKALLGRAGVCARVIESGLIRVNDSIIVL